MKHACLLTLLLLILPIRLLAAETKPIVVPFDLVGSDMVVKATINDKPVRLVVDTGAWNTALRPENAAAYNLILPESGTEEYAAANPITLKLGGLQWKDTSCVFLPKRGVAEPLHYAGLFGMEQMREYAVGFDLQTKRLTFWKGGNLSKAQRDAYFACAGSTAPISTLELEDETDDSYKTVIRLDNQKVRAIIDTGSPISFFGRGVANVMRPLRRTASSEMRFLAGSVPAKLSLLRLMQVGQFELPYFTVAFSDSDKDTAINRYDILGMDALHQTRFILDFPALNLHLQPMQTPWLRLTDLWRQLGINLLGHDVLVVYGETAAASAGLPSASRLLHINGVPLARVKEDAALAARLLQSSSFILTVLDEERKQAITCRVSRREKLNTPLNPIANTEPMESSELFTGKNRGTMYNVRHEEPIVLPPDASIRIFNENFFLIEDPPTGNYPDGAVLYPAGYKGKFPDVPTARWRALPHGIIVILNTPTPAKP